MSEPKPKSKKAAGRAYSYIRFSTAQQADGGSLKRQTDLTEAYCRRKGLTLDDTLSLEDLGVSAFRGTNVRDGALAGFLEACRVGRVPTGSSLVVESLDRLSRDQIRPALQLFMQLQDHGITIVTLQPEREYSPANADALALIEPLIVFARAHEESLMKSHRRRDGWKQARDKARREGGPMLRRCPAWLEVAEDGEGFRVREEAAAVVRQIFDLCRSGYGVQRIVGKLTRDGVPPIYGRFLSEEEIEKHRRQRAKDGAPMTADEEDALHLLGRWTTAKVRVNDRARRVRKWVQARWVKAYVYAILARPAAMGTYQPYRHEGKRAIPDGEPIPGFYPAIITETEWREAQQALGRRDGGWEKGGRGSPAAGRKGKDDGEANLFTGLVRDCKTGEKMHIAHALGRKVQSGDRKRYLYLMASPEGGERGRRFDYAALEYGILKELRELKPADIMPPGEEGKGANDKQAEATRLSNQLLDLADRIERTKARAKKAEDFDAFLDVIEELQGEHRKVSDRLAELEEEKETGGTPATLGEAQTLIDLLKNAAPDERDDLRRRLKLRIRQLVSAIYVLIVPLGRARVAVVQIHFAASNRYRTIIIYHAPLLRSEPWTDTFKRVMKGDDIDLRKKADVRRVEKDLAGVDLAADVAKDERGRV